MQNKVQEKSISIVIPLYNSETTIRQTVVSVLESSYQPLEVIVVDDGSTDHSIDRISDLNITLLKNEINQGVSDTRNRGARHATGDILIFVDSDVCVLKDTFLRMLDYFYNESGVKIVQAIYGENPNLKGWVSRYKNHWLRYTYLKSPDTINWINSSCYAIDRELFFSLGGYQENTRSNNALDDTLLGQKIAEEGIPVLLDKSLYYIHNKEFTLTGLIKNNFFRGKTIVRRFLLDKVTKKHFIKSGNFMNADFFYLSSIVFLYGMLFSLIGAAVLTNLYLWICFLIFLVLFLFANYPFYRYIVKTDPNPSNVLGYAFIAMVDYIVGGLCILGGIIEAIYHYFKDQE